MKIQSRYEYDPQRDLLGSGGFARVFRAQDELLQRQVALKVFRVSGNQGYTVLDEIRKVIGLEHPNLLRYYDVIVMEAQTPLGEKEQTQVGVMEYANAGDLRSFVRASPGSPLMYKLLKDVLLGLEYLHGKGIIHRDLKAQNILLVQEDGKLTAKISDFGISKDTGAGGQSSSVMVGTIEYMAPEQFSPEKYGIDGKVSSNLDLWSFGIMVHELLTDSTPFGNRNGTTTMAQIMNAILSTELPEGIERLPEPYRSVVKRCLVANAKERIKRASELLSYFDNDDGTKVYPKPSSGNAPNVLDKAEDDTTKVYPKHVALGTEANAGRSGKTLASKALTGMAVVLALLLGAGVWWHVAQGQGRGQLAATQAQPMAPSSETANEEKRAIDAIQSKDYKSAYEIFQVYDPVSPRLQAMLGDILQKGLGGVPKDADRARILYQRAARVGDPWAEYQYASMLVSGKGVAKDLPTAATLMLKAAAAGVIEAQNDLGFMYQHGMGITASEEQALAWYEKAARKSYAPAWFNAGFLLQKQGKKAQAIEAYREAAELGHEKAKKALAAAQ